MKIHKIIYDAISEYALKTPEIEVCGYLAGKDGVITKHYELKNLDESKEHFTMDPAEQFATVRDARENDLKIIANFHSHPETPARPSKEDIKLAFDPVISYVIISLADGVDIKSFKIIDGNVEKEEIEII